VFPALEALLPRVAKPVQYVGGELNAQTKDWQAAAVRWALLYPDAYEVGLPNQGIQILYELINERPDALAERCYAVWPDLEALMREHGVPQFTVDAHRPVGAFDLLGVSLATELGYTNLLTALDLAGIPLYAVDRTDEDPIVLAGGHAAFNPEPIADFIDAAVLGDGEEAVALARREEPDLAVMDVKMPRLDGIEAARRILEERPIPIVMVTAYGERELVARAVEAGVFGYLVKPFRETDLLPAIETARARYDELQALREEAESLADALAARKVIERAKGLLMAKEGLSEQDAFARLRKASQVSGRPLKVVAEAVVATLDPEPS
jgi:AmiR/NasT family two-component response regulator